MGNPIGACLAFLCGVGALVGLIFAGKHFWPPAHLNGSCRVDPMNKLVTFDCVRMGKGETFDLSMANVTLEDGSVRTCAPFRLSDQCGGLFGSDKPTAVLAGETRPCKLLEENGYGVTAGSCVEPSIVGNQYASAIIFWVMAPCFFCGCCILAIGVGTSGEGGGKGDEEEAREFLSRQSDDDE